MERALFFAFDHTIAVFGTLAVAALALAVRIGRPRRLVHWAGQLAAVLAIALSAAGLFFFASVRAALEKRVATVSFESPDRAVHRLGDYRGKVVVLNFWATWCPPCRNEMPDLNRLAAAHGGNDVVVLTLSDEDWDAIGRYTSRFPMSTVVGRFTAEPARGGLEAFAYQGRPTTMVIGRDGRVTAQLIGARPYETFDRAVRAAL